jgi:hypothetical protein
MSQKSDLAVALLPTPQRYKLHKMMSGSYQSCSAPTRAPLPWLIHTATKRFTSISYLIAESFMPQALNACHDTKLHEWVSDPMERRYRNYGEAIVLALQPKGDRSGGLWRFKE